jgi:hypothetical protein
VSIGITLVSAAGANVSVRLFVVWADDVTSVIVACVSVTAVDGEVSTSIAVSRFSVPAACSDKSTFVCRA